MCSNIVDLNTDVLSKRPNNLRAKFVFKSIEIKFVIAVWLENPGINIVASTTFPIEQVQFPTVTLCQKNNNPDRWGSAIKIFDYLDRSCSLERYKRRI